jgi:hypothetical protein
MNPFPISAWRLVKHASTWHLSSQHLSRRNALAAFTELVDRRRERLDVEAFLAAHASHAQQTAHTG